jgi:hypothetical protein
MDQEHTLDCAIRGSGRHVNIRFPLCNSNGTAAGALHPCGSLCRSARADISYTEPLKQLRFVRSSSVYFNLQSASRVATGIILKYL